MEGVACAMCTLAAALCDHDIAALLLHVQKQENKQQEHQQPVDFLQPQQQQEPHHQQPCAPPEVRTGCGAAGAAAAAAALLRQAAALAALPSLVQHQQPDSAASGGTASGPTPPQPQLVALAEEAAAAGGPSAGAPTGTLPPLPPLRMVRRRALRGSHVSLLPRVLVLQLLRSVWDPRVGAPVKGGRHVARGIPHVSGQGGTCLLWGPRQEHQSDQRHQGKQEQVEAGNTDLAQRDGCGEGDGACKQGEGGGAIDAGLPSGAGCGDGRFAPYTLTAVVVHYSGAMNSFTDPVFDGLPSMSPSTWSLVRNCRHKDCRVLDAKL